MKWMRGKELFNPLLILYLTFVYVWKSVHVKLNVFFDVILCLLLEEQKRHLHLELV